MLLALLPVVSSLVVSQPASDADSQWTFGRNALRLGMAYDLMKDDSSAELTLETNVALRLSEPRPDDTAFRIWFRGVNRLDWSGDGAPMTLRGLDRLALELPGKLPLLGGIELFSQVPVDEREAADPTFGVRFKPGELVDESWLKLDSKFIDFSVNEERIDLGARAELDLQRLTQSLLPQGTMLDLTVNSRYTFDSDNWSSTLGAIMLFRDGFGKQVDPFVGFRMADFEPEKTTFLVGIEIRF